jgi:hypothetical protein
MVDGGGGYIRSRKKDRLTPSGPESGAMGKDLLAHRGSSIPVILLFFIPQIKRI